MVERFTNSQTAVQIELLAFRGAEAKFFIPDMARLRIEVFREFPYLYDGHEDYEAQYLSTYTASPESLVLIARDGEQVVGASTAIPLKAEVAALQRPFLEHGYDLESIFYFGESVLLKPYRGRGLGKRFFEERERCARASGYTIAAFCAVERPLHHPARPADYQPLDAFWQKRGFQKHPDLSTTFSWKELGEEAESLKPMTFWLNYLKPQPRGC
jgi:GNAT superfamily N-acetyltransferase